MKKNILIVSAHPEPTSLTRQLVDVTVETLGAAGHEIVQSELYGMKWKAVFDADDFPVRTNPDRLSFIMESGHAYVTGNQTPDVVAEQAKLLAADAVILQFPLWWYGVPAILKGWIERVYAFGFAYGYQNGTNEFRFGDGILKGKRALVNVQAGGPVADYGPRGINAPIEQLLFPLTHGALFYPGMDVLPTHAVYSAGHVSTAEEVEAIKAGWRARLAGLFTDAPIPFRAQNGGDFPDRHTMADDVAPGQTGIVAHVAEKLRFVDAVAGDAAAIASVVNGAYRANGAVEGWTNERGLLDGPRIGEAGVRALIARGRILLLRRLTDGAISGCINIAIDDDGAWHTSMLAVAPDEQTAGIGKLIKQEVERQAAAAGAPRMRMEVIRQREALIAWHRRRGYELTGETLAFPYDDPSVGHPLRPDLELVVMEKQLNSTVG